MLATVPLNDINAWRHAVGSTLVELETAIIFADGYSEGEPGLAGAGAIIAANGEIVESICHFIGVTTSESAKYQALIFGLQEAIQLGFAAVEIRMDSRRIVKEMSGASKVSDQSMLPLFRQASALAANFANFKIIYVSLELNREADRLAKQAIERSVQQSLRQ